MKINKITREDVENFRSWGAKANLDEYQQIATKSAIYPGQGTPLGLIYVALKLNGEAGELAEHVGKAMRDDNLMPVAEVCPECEGPLSVAILEGTFTPDRRALIIKEIGDVLWYLSAACNELGITLSEAATINLEKLCSRGERDVLQGSGDER